MFSWPKLYPNMSCVPMYPLYCSVAFPYSTVLVCLCALSIQVLCLKLPSLLLCFLHFHAIMATVLSVDHISASMSLSVLSSTFTLNWFEGITPTFTRCLNFSFIVKLPLPPLQGSSWNLNVGPWT